MDSTTRICTKCKKSKLVEFFSTTQKYCKQCKCAASKKSYQLNGLKINAYQKEYRANHTQTAKEYNSNYYELNKHNLVISQKIYNELHRTQINKSKRKNYKLNKNKYLHQQAKRRCKKLNATVPWDQENILEIYTQSHLTSSPSSTSHVDHIYPLQGDTVSGLHVASNLQILSAYDNLSKSNNYPSKEWDAWASGD